MALAVLPSNSFARLRAPPRRRLYPRPLASTTRSLTHQHRDFSASFHRRNTISNALLSEAISRNAQIDIHQEVQDALFAARKKAVVALETALVTSGMPPPTNLAVARRLEQIVRSHGAIPATIGIVDGRVKIGLSDAELERLADVERDRNIVKVSRRDIGPTIAHRKNGGTTICSTLIFAQLAGIKVIATGGLGGVHRGGENSMDISADLQELTRCSVGVVSCGVKSILDIGRTLEYLETQGVPVLTYGSTCNFPAFFCGQSQFKTNWKVSDPRTAAEILRAQWRMRLQNGTLFAVPMPEEYNAQGAEIQAAVDQAIRESEENGMSRSGKDVTPWLLDRVMQLTEGKSLQNNIALIENTAAIGSQIATEYARLEEDTQKPLWSATRNSTFSSDSNRVLLDVSANDQGIKSVKDGLLGDIRPKAPSKLIVIGASAIDVTGRIAAQAIDAPTVEAMHTTVPGSVSLTVGGVARNIAEAAHRVLASTPSDSNATEFENRDATLLVTPIGEDEFAPFLLDEHARLGMRADGFLRPGADSRTAVVNMLLGASGSLISGVADMDIIDEITEDMILRRLREESPSLVVMDGNMRPSILSAVLTRYCNGQKRIASFFEPTSVTKSTSILPAILSHFAKEQNELTCAPITYVSPNIYELHQMYHEADSKAYGFMNQPEWWRVIEGLGLGSGWRMDLEQLARQPACPTMDKGDLYFLIKDGIIQMAINLLPFFQNLIIKCGERGVAVVMRIAAKDMTSTAWVNERSNPSQRLIIAQSKEMVVLKHFPAIPMGSDEIVGVTGAGDSLVGALCACLVKDPATFYDPQKLDAAINRGQRAAVLSLHSVRAVSPLLGRD